MATSGSGNAAAAGTPLGDDEAAVIDPAAPLAACANCDAPLHGAFCSQCGQRAGLPRPTLWDLVNELSRYFLKVDGKLLRTVRQLFRPGHLTVEYLRGRRERYEKPFKLFVVLNVLFFLAAGVVRSTAFDARSSSGFLDGMAGLVSGFDQANAARARAGQPLKPESPRIKLIRKVLAQPRELIQARVRERYLRWGPRLMLALVPLTALFLRLIYRRRAHRYPEHFVFSLHFHAFGALLSFPMQLINWGPLLAAGQLLDWAYLLVAIHVVFGDGWRGTTWRWAVLALLMLATRVALTNALLLSAIFAPG